MRTELAIGGLIGALYDAPWYFAVCAGLVCLLLSAVLFSWKNRLDNGIQQPEYVSILTGILALVVALVGFVALAIGLAIG